MPHYDHLCNKCNKPFVIEMKISEVDKKKFPAQAANQGTSLDRSPTIHLPAKA